MKSQIKQLGGQRDKPPYTLSPPVRWFINITYLVATDIIRSEQAQWRVIKYGYPMEFIMFFCTNLRESRRCRDWTCYIRRLLLWWEGRASWSDQMGLALFSNDHVLYSKTNQQVNSGNCTQIPPFFYLDAQIISGFFCKFKIVNSVKSIEVREIYILDFC